MTTIAYNHKDKEIAVDSRETAGDIIARDDAVKYKKVSGEHYIGSGAVSDCELLESLLISGEQCNKDLDCNVMFTANGKVFNSICTAEGGVKTWEVNRDYTMGSGDSFALAALDFGKSAKDAVKYAMTRDIYSGGRVRVIKVK